MIKSIASYPEKPNLNFDILHKNQFDILHKDKEGILSEISKC